jgi:NitT/TauT family transport system permease protein
MTAKIGILSRVTATIVGLVALLAAWQLVFYLEIVSRAVIASPAEVIVHIPLLWKHDGILVDWWATLYRSVVAFSLGAPIGIALGYLIGSAGAADKPGEAALDFIRSIPATALIPIFLVVFGVGDSAKIGVGAFSCALVVALSVILGRRAASITRQDVVQLYGLGAVRRFALVHIPESLPQVFVGLRAGASLALILVVVSEMFIGTTVGLGKVINDMRYTDDTPRQYLALITSGVLGFLMNLALAVAERLVVHWRGR